MTKLFEDGGGNKSFNVHLYNEHNKSRDEYLRPCLPLSELTTDTRESFNKSDTAS